MSRRLVPRTLKYKGLYNSNTKAFSVTDARGYMDEFSSVSMPYGFGWLYSSLLDVFKRME